MTPRSGLSWSSIPLECDLGLNVTDFRVVRNPWLRCRNRQSRQQNAAVCRRYLGEQAGRDRQREPGPSAFCDTALLPSSI